MKRTAIIIGITILLLAGFFTLLGTGVVKLSTTAQGQYISIPKYGILECKASESIARSPEIGEWVKFDSQIINCQQVGTLVQNCVVTLKNPSKSDDVAFNAYIGWSTTSLGSSCPSSASEVSWVKRLGVTTLSDGYDVEHNIPITKNQQVCAYYLEGSIIDLNPSNNLKNKGRYAISYYPFFIYRQDNAFIGTGQAILGTEDCTNGGNIQETNFIIEDVLGGGRLSSQLQESELLDINNIRSSGAVFTYISNWAPVVPQYGLFEEDGLTKYCIGERIYRVEEVVTPSGTYLVADTSSNKVLREVECCNNGEVPSGYQCVDFEEVPLSTSEGQECNEPFNKCPIVGYLPLAGGKVASQECVDNKCVTTYLDVACNFDEECFGGYCEQDLNHPENNKCVTRTPTDYCGNGVCEASRGETDATCKKDCDPTPIDDVLLYIVIGILAGLVVLFLAGAILKPRTPTLKL